jgi:D-xylulose reductase
VRFWATPPIHGILRPTVVHPSAFTFKVPDSVSLAEAAMVEPLAIGMHAAGKARIRPGDVAVVIGAGTIGMVTAMAAMAGGCSNIIITDLVQPKLELAATLGPVTAVNVKEQDLQPVVDEMTDGWGADIVFECSGAPQVAPRLFEPLRPGGRVVYVGMPVEPIQLDIVAAQVKEASVETIFRYAHVYPRALALMASGKIDVKPLMTDTFSFEDSIKAVEYCVNMPPTSVKVQIEMPS